MAFQILTRPSSIIEVLDKQSFRETEGVSPDARLAGRSPTRSTTSATPVVRPVKSWSMTSAPLGRATKNSKLPTVARENRVAQSAAMYVGTTGVPIEQLMEP